MLLRFGTAIDVEVNKKAIAHMAALDKPSWLGGVKEVLPTYAALFVKYDPLRVSRSQVEQWCEAAVASDAPAQGAQDSAGAPRVISIPVHYGGKDGPDIDEAAQLAGLSSADEVARLHASGDYRVYFLGFLGGFPYLGGLPAALAKVPRLTTPRQKLPKGTVGIAGGQTGVYTISTPGGWYCLGRTQMKLFDPSQDPPAMLRAGDFVKFTAVQEEVVEEAASVEVAPAPAKPWIEVLVPGPLTTVQDAGRYGYARHGVSRAGAADDLALRMGNALLGNEEGAAALEVTMGGLKIRCVEPCAVALTGADCGAKLSQPGKGAAKRSVRVNQVVALHRDDEVELGFAKDGMRAYLCVQGGVDVPVVLGSRSTDLRAGLGGFQGRGLKRGDAVGRLGDDASSAGLSQPAICEAVHDPLRSTADGANGGGGRAWRLRVLPGPGDPQTDVRHASELSALVGAEFKVLPRADRMAVCITPQGREKAKAAAERLRELRTVPYGLSEYRPPEMLMGAWSVDHMYDLLTGGQQMSEGTVSGTVQLPPDGNPVILLAEHQTTGGYKVPAVVIQADLWQVGQMRPGDRIRFQRTTPEEAVNALRDLRQKAGDIKVCSVEHRDACAARASADAERLEASDAGKTAETGEARGRLPMLSGLRASPSRPSPAAFGNLMAASAQLWSGLCGSPSLARGVSSLVPRSGSDLRQIDLNADCGEGFDDAGLLQYVTSVNISCGAHAGTTESIAEVVRLAAACGAGIGAHVSFVDREGFGRRALDTPPQELFDQTLWQASALDGLCRGAGTRVRYIKPHGALYHSVMAGGEQGQAVFEAAQKLELPLLLMPLSPWAGYGEGFAERRYDGDKLRSRDKEGAVIHEPHEAAEQAVALAAQASIHSICVHGDSPNAVAVAKEVRGALERHFELRPFCPPR